MTVPFIDLSRSVAPIADVVLEDWRDCLAKTAFVGGPRVKEFEVALSDHLGAPEFLSCGNGTDAIVVTLQALGVGLGSRVALPDVTFWASYEAPVQLGATPVLIDIDDDLQLDLDELARAHEKKKLDAIVLPHLYGWCSARTEAIRTFCREHSIALLEDSAQAFGVRLGERSIYDTEVATISFYPAKVLGGSADGGGVFIADPDLAAKTRSLFNHGRSDHYAYARVGWNSRMSSPNAAFLTRMLARADELLASRRNALGRYATLITELADERVRLHLPPEGVTGNGYLCTLTVDGMAGDEIAAKLREKGIGCARTYPAPLHVQPPAAGNFEAVSDLSRSQAFCESVINLPLFAGITDDEVDESVAAFTSAIAS